MRKPLFLLWILCVVGFWAHIPYVQYLEILPDTIPVWRTLLLGTVQTALLFGFICWLSSKILPKTDLHPFVYRNFLKQIAYPGIVAGILVGGAIFTFDQTVFHSSLLSGVHPPFWAGALVSLYGGVNEEVLFRLFLFTLIYFLFGKVIKIHGGNRVSILWSVNLLVAILFGMGHLPAVSKQLTSLSAFEIYRVLFLNGIAGIVFGWLYWSRGLWTAIVAHFVTDLMIHVFLFRMVA